MTKTPIDFYLKENIVSSSFQHSPSNKNNPDNKKHSPEEKNSFRTNHPLKSSESNISGNSVNQNATSTDNKNNSPSPKNNRENSSEKSVFYSRKQNSQNSNRRNSSSRQSNESSTAKQLFTYDMIARKSDPDKEPPQDELPKNNKKTISSNSEKLSSTVNKNEEISTVKNEFPAVKTKSQGTSPKCNSTERKFSDRNVHEKTSWPVKKPVPSKDALRSVPAHQKSPNSDTEHKNSAAENFEQQRSKVVIHLEYDPELPVCEKRQEIADLIKNNQVIVLCGETGSGKSTQLPKICLELGYGIKKLIGHTQPRRIAARSVAGRIAEELKTPLGQGVGYKIRFTDECGPMTRIKLMTDGILLAESQTDPNFNRYEVIIIDEAHERSLNIDFLLGMLKRVLTRRKDLKLIITSATIDAQKFAEHFSTFSNKVPVIEVSGRTWPIEILYRPVDPRELSELEEQENFSEDIYRTNKKKMEVESDEDAYERTLLSAIDETARRERGDVLIFMPTEHDIFETARLLKHHRIPGDDAVRKTEILPLYARLPGGEQQKIFQKSFWRKIVIATNVAESSLTVPGIKYVIDTGTARISRYSARSKTQRLPIEPISRASADQRAGRCGRIGPGVCIRLYSEQDYLSRDRYTIPEIRRTNLASVILQTKAFRLGAVEHFPFIDPPAISAVNDGYKTLFEIGAIDQDHNLTAIGRKLARLPVDPRIARMIIAADDEKCLRDMLIIASALEIQDPRDRPFEQKENADAKHAPFLDDNSDFLSWLKLWDFWQELKNKLSQSQLRKAARENFLSWNRMREWTEIHLQLQQLAKDSKLTFLPRQGNYDAIHKAILAGLLYGVARKTDTPEYITTGNTKFYLWPGSGVKKKKHLWLVASERIETSQKYLRTLGRINPEWIEPIAEHLLEHRCFDPFWNAKNGYVQAWERVLLYGLEIISKRRINFGPIDPKQSRDIFIRCALVAGDLYSSQDRSSPNKSTDDYDDPDDPDLSELSLRPRRSTPIHKQLDFFVKNQQTREEAEKLQAKLRNFRLLRSEEVVYQFYEKRIPANVYDKTTLEKWYRSLSPEEKNSLLLTFDDLCTEEIPDGLDENYPNSFQTLHGMNLPIEYQFRPGESDDGLSITTGVEALGQLDTVSLGWLVPGLLEYKIASALKTLPKEMRRELVPIPETARSIAAEISFGNGDFFEELARYASRRAGKFVTVDDFDRDRLPPDLAMNIKVVGEDGELLGESRDLNELREKLGTQVSQTFNTVQDSQWNRDGLKKWDFGTLPDFVPITSKSIHLKGYPALCDPQFLSEEGKKLSSGTVSLRLFDTPDRAQRHFQFGLLRLFCMKYHDELFSQAKWIPELRKYALLFRSVSNIPLLDFIIELIAAIACSYVKQPFPRNEGEFNYYLKECHDHLIPAVQEITHWLSQFIPVCHTAHLLVEQNKRGNFTDFAEDVEFQLSQLLIPHFQWEVSWDHLKEYPRYMKGIMIRFEKIKSGGGDLDRRYSDEMVDLWNEYVDYRDKQNLTGVWDPELNLYRWMLEEYRISLFAQKLGTSMKISPARLAKQLEKVYR